MSDGKLTLEVLNKAFEAVRAQGVTPRHDCRYDGHVEHFMSTRCVYCHEQIRKLTVDESHVRYGEFW